MILAGFYLPLLLMYTCYFYWLLLSPCHLCMVVPGSPEGGGPTELLVEAAEAQPQVHHGHGRHSAHLELLPTNPGSEHSIVKTMMLMVRLHLKSSTCVA